MSPTAYITGGDIHAWVNDDLNMVYIHFYDVVCSSGSSGQVIATLPNIGRRYVPSSYTYIMFTGWDNGDCNGSVRLDGQGNMVFYSSNPVSNHEGSYFGMMGDPF